MDPFFSFLLTLEFKIFDPFVASPFHLFHFNIPLNSIWILFKYIWRIIVFLFQQLFSSHSQSSTDIIKLLPSFLLRSYPPHFSSLLRGQLRFWFFNAGQRKVEGSIWEGISHQRSCPWMANSNFSFNLFLLLRCCLLWDLDRYREGEVLTVRFDGFEEFRAIN